jgi:hypothetical protein
MTSPAIRDAVKAHLQAYWSLCPYFDLSDYITLDEMPAGPTDKVLLLSFGFSSETMATPRRSPGASSSARCSGASASATW